MCVCVCVFSYLYVNLCLPGAKEKGERTEIAHITASFGKVKHYESQWSQSIFLRIDSIMPLDFKHIIFFTVLVVEKKNTYADLHDYTTDGLSNIKFGH